jgi:uncharacterized phage protein (TIGR01671 family)
MTREIKFRLKIDGEWIFTGDKPHYFWQQVYESGSETTETLGQFTGLKDKNGKEIYEGDILGIERWGDEGTGKFDNCMQVEFKYGQFGCFIGDRDFRPGWRTIYSLTGSPVDGRDGKFEVSGNIYENPELLK